MKSVLSALRREEKNSLKLISEAGATTRHCAPMLLSMMAGKAIGKVTGSGRKRRRRMSAATRQENGR